MGDFSNLMDTSAALALLDQYDIAGSEDERKALARAAGHDRRALTCIGQTLKAAGQSAAQALAEPRMIARLAAALVAAELPELADKLVQAVYRRGLYATLGSKEGELADGERIAAAARLPHLEALFAMDLGHLDRAEETLQSILDGSLKDQLSSRQEDKSRGEIAFDSLHGHIARENLSDLMVLRGRLPQAEALMEQVIADYESKDMLPGATVTRAEMLFASLARGEFMRFYHATSGANPYARRAVARGLQGNVREALADFGRAEKFQQNKLRLVPQLKALQARRAVEAAPEPEPLIGQAAVHYALLLTRMGKLRTALDILSYSRRWAVHPHNGWHGMAAFIDTALADVYRSMGQMDRAGEHLSHARSWAEHAGHAEIACWSQIGAARLALARDQLADAYQAADTARGLAEDAGLGLYRIDAELTAGRVAWRQGDLAAAETCARAALERAGEPGCGYAWAQGSALHLLAEIFASRELVEPARIHAHQAEAIRQRIGDPRLANTQAVLARLPTPRKGE